MDGYKLPTEAELRNLGVSDEDIKELRRNYLLLAKEVEVQDKYREDNKLYFFKPNKPQGDFFNALVEANHNGTYDTLAVVGDNQFGKTTMLVVAAICLAIGEIPWLNGGTKLKFNHSEPRIIKYIGQNFDDHIKHVIIPAFKKWWPKDRKLRNDSSVFPLEWIDEVTGGKVILMTSSQQVERHAGLVADAVLSDEPLSRECYDENVARLIVKNGIFGIGATLLAGHIWVWRDIIKGCNEDGTPKTNIKVIFGKMTDNVGYGIKDKAQIEKALRMWGKDSEAAKARLGGKPSFLSNLIYPSFDRRLKPIGHLVKRFEIPCDWMVDIALDIHPSTEQAVLFMATSERDYKYLVDEIWEHGSVQKIANKVVKMVKSNGYRVNRVVIDPSTKGGNKNEMYEYTTYEIFDSIFKAHGLPLELASKDRDSCELAANEMLMSQNEQPTVWFFSDLKRIIWEVEGLLKDVKTGKRIDKDDHMCENWGRLAILGTKYREMEMEEEGYKEQRVGNSITGY